jgi:hypothetical protein
VNEPVVTAAIPLAVSPAFATTNSTYSPAAEEDKNVNSGLVVTLTEADCNLNALTPLASNPDNEEVATAIVKKLPVARPSLYPIEEDSC